MTLCHGGTCSDFGFGWMDSNKLRFLLVSISFFLALHKVEFEVETRLHLSLIKMRDKLSVRGAGLGFE